MLNLNQLTKGRAWLRATFAPGSRPTLEQLAEWIASGEVPGVVIAGTPFVYADRFALQKTQPKQESQPTVTVATLLA